MNAPRSGSFLIIFLLFFLSGATGLVYEVIWLRQLILIFGSTQFATSTVLSTFMGGLALGALLAGRWLKGRTYRPIKLYGLLEIGIGLYALAVPFLFRSLSPIYQWAWSGGASESFMLFSLAKFVGIAAVLLPPTILMGASLPILAAQIADDPERIGGKVGGLYAINIFGAVVGVFLAGFLAIPMIGVQMAIWITALTNVLIGLTAIVIAKDFAIRGTMEAEEQAPSGPRSGRVRLVLVIFGLSGFGALVLEVAWTRVLALVLGSSVYAFSLMLLAFLIGLAAGGGFFSAYLRRRPKTDPTRLLALLLASTGVLAYASCHIFQFLPRIFAEIFIAYDPPTNGWFLVQFGLGLLVMFPTTFALGGIFPTVLQIHARSLSEVAGSVGAVYASNTVGTIIGAGTAGFILIPNLHVLNTVLSISIVQIILALLVAVVLLADTAKKRMLVVAPTVILLALMLLLRPGWDILLMNSGVFNLYGKGKETKTWDDYLDDAEKSVLVYSAEGLTASVFVADEPEYDNRFLSVNGKVEASTNSDLETQLLAAHLPLLVHKDPKDVLVIGLASGITVGAAATHRSVENILILEIEETMIPAARLFEEDNGYVLDDPRVEISINDARNELEFSADMYDVVISEPSNPWMTIAANLFTEEFFQMAKTRVRPDGIYCQWVQNYYLPADDLKSIVAAFQASFPNIMLFETIDGIDLLMLGSQTPMAMDVPMMEKRMSDLWVRADLARINMMRPLDLLSTFRSGTQEIARMVDGAARNTDDNARVEFSAPRALGKYTITKNLAMLRAHAGDVLDYLDPPVSNPEKLDVFNLALAEILANRDYYSLATTSASKVNSGPLYERARKMLKDLERAKANR